MELIRLIMVITFLGVFLSSSNVIKFNVACNPRDREALISFKHNLKGPSYKLSYWVGKDCCKWEGVICKNKTESHGNDLVVQLKLSNCSLSGELSPSLVELKNLNHLDLSYNNFTRIRIPAFLGSLQNLRYLDLSANELEGEIPRTLGNLCNLEVLDLSQNKLQGELSRLFRNSSRCLVNKLKSLNVGYNLLSGRLPDELGSLHTLEELFLKGNSFSGLICQPHFANLTRLKVLDIGSMILNVSHEWVPPFQLRQALLRNCSVGYRVPEWLQTQKHLVEVDISNAGISGSVPSWFWNVTSKLESLNISYNQLEGDLSNVLLGSNSLRGGYFYLNSNRFTGNLPLISSHVETLDLSKNYLSGPISILLCNPVEDMNSLSSLDLSENQLSGMVPDCWSPWRSLVVINFHSNKITGNFPSSMGFLKQLRGLHLQKNSIKGEFPSSLQNCTKLRIIDLGENRLTGAIPTWIGERLEYLIVLRLHSNQFHGEIPRKLCYLIRIQILDIAHNNLSGSIPKCFTNFSRMSSNPYPVDFFYYNVLRDKYTVEIVSGGIKWAYYWIGRVTSIDLSDNKLYGKIPEELTYLSGMRFLNLSNNIFIGGIPKGIGHLNSLESLDLSNNKLWGSIPQSLANITLLRHLNLSNNNLSGEIPVEIPNKIGFLSSLDLSNNKLSGAIPQSMVNLTSLVYLNLSYNNLSGEIPSGTQLQTFSELSYIGNHNLCGLPLNKCDEDGQHQKAPNGEGEGSMEDNEDWIEMKWFCMGLPLGFVLGLLCLWGVLMVKKSWRYVYFRLLDDIIYKLSPCLMQKKK